MLGLSEFKEQTADLTEEEFLHKFRKPAIVLALPESAATAADSNAVGGTVNSVESLKSTDLSALNEPVKLFVLFVHQMIRPASNVVTVGRASVNDLRIPVATVSKIHGYFLETPDDWFIAFGGAKNGLFVNGTPVDVDGHCALNCGDRVSFGPDVHATFYSSKGLLNRIRR